MHGTKRRLTLLWLAVLPACSTVDQGPLAQCENDVDCGVGSVCVEAQGICVPEELPPQAAIGFEIKSGDLRVELLGCDPEVTRELGGSELRVQKLSKLVNEYDIRATTRRSIVNCGGNECTGVCDADALTCSEPEAASLSLTMASRLGLSELNNKQNFVTDPPPPVGELPSPKTFLWPSYEAVEAQAHAARVLDIAPGAESDNLSAFRRVLADDAPTEVDAIGVLRCQRGLYGIEGGVRTLLGSPVIGATVEFRHAEAIAAPSTVIGTPPSCSGGEECPLGWACNEQTGTCGLDLTDASAGSSISTEDLVGGYLPAWVYTYCEEAVYPVAPLVREFTVTVTPPQETGLPTVLYSLEQGFLDPATESSVRQVEVEGQLCLPDWQPPQAIEFFVTGEPVELSKTELGTYACCSTACLPTGEIDVEPTPPPNVGECAGFDRVRFETRWFNPDLAIWAVAGCVPTTTYPDGSNGRFRTDVTSCEDEVCSAGLTPGALEDLTRNYSVAITQVVGSVFQSQRFKVQIDPATTELAPFELLPRVLLHGNVSCRNTASCVTTNALVWAERLRVDTDEPDLPGPFFFDTKVDANGDFLMPLDPGVYVVTALPAVGQPGGPARFSIVDLREGSSLVDMVEGVPHATLGDPLELGDGILVRVALDGFEVSTGVAPLDVGSWKAQSEFPSDLFDLNDPLTCYATDGAVRRGCLIRRLSQVTISLLSSKRVQFTARNRGGNKCE